MSEAADFIDLDWNGRRVEVEYRWAGDDDPGLPLIVFLHEGLGSLSMWRDFPDRLCRGGGFRGLVYSRPGYGWSTPRAEDECWGTDFMHRQALDLLPALLDALEIDIEARPPWLLGHSDGGSIALIYAARYPAGLAGAILLSPHVMVEDISISSIEKARRAYLETDLKHKLARYHADPDSAFWGWNDIWLDPDFRDWSIVDELAAIRCPLLALQGVNDEYGTLEQVRTIARQAPQTQLVELPQCGHSPHRDQAEELIRVITRFLAAPAAGRENLAGAG